MLNRDEEAIENYEIVLKNDPNNIEAWRLKAESLSHLNRFEEARDCYDKMIEIADRAIEKISMAGLFHAPDPVKKVLENKQFTLLGGRRKLFLKGPSDNILDWNEENEEGSK